MVSDLSGMEALFFSAPVVVIVGVLECTVVLPEIELGDAGINVRLCSWLRCRLRVEESDLFSETDGECCVILECDFVVVRSAWNDIDAVEEGELARLCECDDDFCTECVGKVVLIEFEGDMEVTLDSDTALCELDDECVTLQNAHDRDGEAEESAKDVEAEWRDCASVHEVEIVSAFVRVEVSVSIEQSNASEVVPFLTPLHGFRRVDFPTRSCWQLPPMDAVYHTGVAFVPWMTRVIVERKP